MPQPFSEPFPAPEYPERSWFTEKPEWLTPGMKLRVDEDGRAAGYFYKHGQALVHDPTAKVKPSLTRYKAFEQNGVILSDGEFLPVGVIGNTGGHADGRAPISVALAHYADPDKALLHVKAYDDDYGGYVVGAMLPGKTWAEWNLLNRAALSGDWRATFTDEWWRENGIAPDAVRSVQGFDCIGPTLVTRPGLPLIQPVLNDEGVLVAMLGGMGGIQLEEERPMNTTRVEVPGGIVVETSAPVPDAQVAAPPPPPPPGGGGGGDGSGSGSAPTMDDVVAAIQSLDDRVSAIEDMLSSQASAEAAAIAASVHDLVPPFAES